MPRFYRRATCGCGHVLSAYSFRRNHAITWHTTQVAMIDQSRPKIIKDHPIGDGLDAFHASFKLIYLQKLSIDLILALQGLRVSRLLRSASGGKNLFSDLSRLGSSVNSDVVDLDRIIPLLNAVLTVDPDDALIWDQVYRAISEPTPPPDR
ncbi:hypothetical protein B0J13DRAFT_630750 [Dactylonectria estremocensis]|uniref:Uncharacterized protein n=1 Tax=Dactylonectria estremocensis TaxID=1079267 RepID=A0A9P9D945_9HYPO|nr:hypothetical protein B0J13DRAFT_630750 [Dactylonectria estremocensis]